MNGLAPGMVALDIGDAVWRKYIPEALAAGQFNALRDGVSAKKIVIEISGE